MIGDGCGPKVSIHFRGTPPPFISSFTCALRARYPVLLVLGTSRHGLPLHNGKFLLHADGMIRHALPTRKNLTPHVQPYSLRSCAVLNEVSFQPLSIKGNVLL